MIFMIAAGGVLYVLLVRPWIGTPAAELTVIMTTIAGAMFLENLALYTFGARLKALDQVVTGTVTIAGTAMQAQNLLVIILAPALLGSLALFLEAQQAWACRPPIAQNNEAARLLGIKVERTYLLTFSVSALTKTNRNQARRPWARMSNITYEAGQARASAGRGGRSDSPVGAAGIALYRVRCLAGCSRSCYDRVSHLFRWVGASALALASAMLIIFIGASTPAVNWPPFAVLGVAAVTGVLTGAALGLVRLVGTVADRASTVKAFLLGLLFASVGVAQADTVRLERGPAGLASTPKRSPIRAQDHPSW